MVTTTTVKRIYLELTNTCNLACPFCLKTQRSTAELPLNLVEKIMRQSQNLCDYLYLHVQGEPLLYPRIAEVLALADKYQRQIQLVTNGTLLKEKQELLLKTKALRKIAISLQGLFLAENLTDKLTDLAEFLQAAKATKVIVELRFWGNNPAITTYLKERYSYSVTQGSKRQVDDRLFINYQKQFDWPSLNPAVQRQNTYCIGPSLMLCVLSNGTITPCCLDVEGRLSLGNIQNSSLSEALINPRYLSLIRGFQDNKVLELLCQHCNYGDIT